MSGIFADASPSFMPSCEVPISICPGLEDVDIEDKLGGMMTFKVVSKDEYGIEIQIKSITLNPKKRIA